MRISLPRDINLTKIALNLYREVNLSVYKDDFFGKRNALRGFRM